MKKFLYVALLAVGVVVMMTPPVMAQEEKPFTKNVSTWIEIHHAAFAGNTGPFQTGQSADAELYQGNMTFDQLWSKNFSLRIGRQEIVAGNELLLGDLDFYTGISHDGGVGTWKLKKVNLMVWYTRPFDSQVSLAGGAQFSPPGTYAIGAADGTQNFYGGYATWVFKKDQTFDVYGMNLNARATSNIQTVGARYAHDSTTKDGFIWDAELA